MTTTLHESTDRIGHHARRLGLSPLDVALSVTNGVETVHTYARHRDCSFCGHRLEDRVEGAECAECVDLKTRAVQGIAGLTPFVVWHSSGRGRTYTRWFTVSFTVARWRDQNLPGRVIAFFGGGKCGPATALYLRANGELWRFWERDGRGLRATLLGTVQGRGKAQTFTPDKALRLRTAEEYRASQRARVDAAIGRAVFG